MNILEQLYNTFWSFHVLNMLCCIRQVSRPFEHATEEELVNEFVSDSRAKMAPTSFRMDSLLREMQEIDGARMRHAPLQGGYKFYFCC